MRISYWSSDVCSSDLPPSMGACGTSPAPTLCIRLCPLSYEVTPPPGGFRHCRSGGGDARARRRGDRKRVVEGKSVSGRVDLGGGRIIKKKKRKIRYIRYIEL